MSDSLVEGRSCCALSIIDDHNRECLLSQGSVSLPSASVVKHLNELIDYYGKPKLYPKLCIRIYKFTPFITADKIIEDYNDNHPHQSLGDLSPKAFGNR